MTLARRFNTVACLAVFAACMGYCLADGKLLLGLLVCAGCAFGWWSGRFDPPKSLPRWSVNLLVLAAIIDAVMGVTRARAGGTVVSDLAQFLVYIQLIKFLDRRTPRDDAHLLALSVFIGIGSVLTSNTLGVGVLLLVYTPLAITGAMLLQLHAGHRAAVARRPGSAGEFTTPPVAGPGHRRDFRRASSFAVVASLGLAMLAFLFTPRGLGSNVLGSFGKIGRSATIGFTDTISLGQSGFLKPDDQTPVLEVRLFDERDTDMVNVMGELYLRGTARDRYNRGNRTWELSERGELALGSRRGSDRPPAAEPDFPLRSHSVPLSPREYGSSFLRQEITLFNPRPTGGYLFALWRPVGDLEVEGDARGTSHEISILRYSGFDSGGRLRYSVESAREYTNPFESPRRPPTFDSEMIVTLASSILADRGIPVSEFDRGAPENRAAATAFLLYLRQDCAYTLEMAGPLAGEDPIEMFLFRTKRGHCEYFASAMVSLCQSVGLPARIVAGYLASEYSNVSASYVVRESDAHAWTEVRIEPGRWAVFDPSPPEVIARLHSPARGLLGRLRQLYEAAEFSWINNVVTFDESKRSGLLDETVNLSALVSRISALLRGLTGNASMLSGKAASMVRLVGLLVAAAAVTGVIVLRVRRRRLRGRSRGHLAFPGSELDAELQRLARQASFYARAIDLLTRAGLAKPRWRPPLAHAAAVAPARPDVADPLAVLAGFYYRLRFARRPLSAAEAEQAERALGALEVAASAPAATGGPGAARV